MTLLDSLLDAILRLDGDALVMHVGEKPYVVTTSSSMTSFRGPLSWGQVELSSRPLTADAVLGMLGQMLTHEQCRQLYEIGAIEHEIAAPGTTDEQFIVTAARGGEDVWVEVRRKAKAKPGVVSPDAEPAMALPATVPAVNVAPPPASIETPITEQPAALEAGAAIEPVGVRDEPASDLEEPETVGVRMPDDGPAVPLEIPLEIPLGIPLGINVPLEPAAMVDSDMLADGIIGQADGIIGQEDQIVEGEPEEIVLDGADEDLELTLDLGLLATGHFRRDARPAGTHQDTMPIDPVLQAAGFEPISIALPEAPAGRAWDNVARPASTDEDTVAELLAAISRDVVEDGIGELAETPSQSTAAAGKPVVSVPVSDASELVAPVELVAPAEPAAPVAPAEPVAPAAIRPEPDVPVVVSIARPSLKRPPVQPPPPPAAASTEASLVELLRTAVSRRASTLYVVTGSRPMIRVDSEIAQLGTEPIVTSAEVERFALEFAPRDQVAAAPREWTSDVPGVGHVRSVAFDDHSGVGLILHLPSSEERTAPSLGLEPKVQALCDQPDGLILVAGPRSSGKSTLLDAFVELINQTRNEHVVTIESEIRIIHEKRRSFISQREVRGDGDAFAVAAKDALREKPDVLVIADLRAPEAIGVALDAARAGRLVFGAIAAPTASAAVERLIDAFADDRRPQIRALIAGALRAVVAQILLERPGGGLVAARELLINSPAVGKLIVDGTTSQLPVAIEAGRRLGMQTMNDALGALVRDGIVDAAEACRRAPDLVRAHRGAPP